RDLPERQLVEPSENLEGAFAARSLDGRTGRRRVIGAPGGGIELRGEVHRHQGYETTSLGHAAPEQRIPSVRQNADAPRGGAVEEPRIHHGQRPLVRGVTRAFIRYQREQREPRPIASRAHTGPCPDPHAY